MYLKMSKFLKKFKCDKFTLKLLWLSHFVSLTNSSNIPFKIIEFESLSKDECLIHYNSRKEDSIEYEIKSLQSLRDRVRKEYGLPPLQEQPKDLFGFAL